MCEDVELLPQILNNSDLITLETLEEKKGPNREDRIISRRQTGNKYVVVEEARPKKGLKKLVVITVWKEKSGTPLTTSDRDNVNAEVSRPQEISERPPG